MASKKTQSAPDDDSKSSTGKQPNDKSPDPELVATRKLDDRKEGQRDSSESVACPRPQQTKKGAGKSTFISRFFGKWKPKEKQASRSQKEQYEYYNYASTDTVHVYGYMCLLQFACHDPHTEIRIYIHRLPGVILEEKQSRSTEQDAGKDILLI